MGKSMARMAASMGVSMLDEQILRNIEAVEKVVAEERWPALETVKAGADGEVWVRDVHPFGVKRDRWIRLTPQFEPVGWIELGEGDMLLAVGHGLALVRTTDAYDVQTVVCYRVGGAA
jgi:hypothetical protein